VDTVPAVAASPPPPPWANIILLVDAIRWLRARDPSGGRR